MNQKSQPKPPSSAPAQPVIDVAMLPALMRPESLDGETVIVVDVLRATTTIINALANGCSAVLPQPSIEAARDCHTKTDNSLIGGERGGRIVEGFHGGNSPVEYTPERIAGKSLILATTNGTVAMEKCRGAKRILIGAMVNLGAVAEAVLHDEKVTVLCSGTDRRVTSEDVLFAGAMVERIVALRKNVVTKETRLSDQAKVALNHWSQTSDAINNDGRELVDFFRKAAGGINLVRIGHDDDVVFASQIDCRTNVPELDQTSWSIS